MDSSTLALRIARTLTAPRVRLVGQVLLVGGLIFAVYRLRSLWGDSRIGLGDVSWPLLTAATLCAVVGVGASGFVWLVILDRLGVTARGRWSAIVFQSQLAKYIP